MNRRSFIKSGLLFIPTIYSAGVHGSVHLSNLDPEVADWRTRVRTNLGNYSGLSIVAQDTAMKMVKASGHRSKVMRWNLYCGLDQLACVVPLVTGNAQALDVRTGTAGGWTYTEATGLVGNGTDNYLTTGFVPDNYWTSVDSCCFGAYVRTKLLTTDAIMGSNDGTNVDYLLVCYGGTISYVSIHSPATQISFADTAGLGHYMGSRNASNSLVLYKNGVSSASTATPGGARVTNWGFLVHAYNVNGLAGAWSARIIGEYEICTGLTAAEVLGHYSAVHRAMTILGRNV